MTTTLPPSNLMRTLKRNCGERSQTDISRGVLNTAPLEKGHNGGPRWGWKVSTRPDVEMDVALQLTHVHAVIQQRVEPGCPLPRRKDDNGFGHIIVGHLLKDLTLETVGWVHPRTSPSPPVETKGIVFDCEEFICDVGRGLSKEIHIRPSAPFPENFFSQGAEDADPGTFIPSRLGPHRSQPSFL